MAGLGLRPVSDTSDRPGQHWAGLDAGDGLRPANSGLRRVAGWAGPEASLSHEAAKPWVGCWLLGSRTTLLVAPGTSAGRAGLSCAWAGMGGLLAAGQPDYAAGCAWNLGWAGWAELCLGGLLDGQGLFHA